MENENNVRIEDMPVIGEFPPEPKRGRKKKRRDPDPSKTVKELRKELGEEYTGLNRLSKECLVAISLLRKNKVDVSKKLPKAVPTVKKMRSKKKKESKSEPVPEETPLPESPLTSGPLPEQPEPEEIEVKF